MPRYDDEDDWDDDRPRTRRRHDEDEDDRPRRRRRYEEDEYDFRRTTAQHSGMGIVSLLIGLVAGVLLFGVLVIAAVLSAEEPDGELDEESPELMVLTLGFVAGMGLALIGAVLGGVGLGQKRNKLFPALGLTLNGLVLVGVLGVVCLGLAAG